MKPRDDHSFHSLAIRPFGLRALRASYPGFNGPALFWSRLRQFKMWFIWTGICQTLFWYPVCLYFINGIAVIFTIKWRTPYKIWVLVDFYWKYPRHMWYHWEALHTREIMVIFKFQLTRFQNSAHRFPPWLSELNDAGGSRRCAGPANYWYLVLLNSIKSKLTNNKVTQIYNQVKGQFKTNLLVFFFFKLVLHFWYADQWKWSGVG